MKAGTIFIKTLPFVWAKLLLWLITIAVSIAWLAILGFIANAIGNSGALAVLIVVGLVGVRLARFIIMRYFGYLIKAGHIAVITEAVVTGKVPDNQVVYGKNMVKERFLTANVFFLIDGLVSGAVKQLQRAVGKVGDLLKFIPGMKMLASMAKFFIEISLGYVDECCLGYTFYCKDQGAFKSAADGVVIYFQNWKKLLGNAAKTMIMVFIAIALITAAFIFLFISAINLIAQGSTIAIFVAVVIALMVALAVKSAFIDSFILVRTMAVYMQVAPETTITFNLYDKLCGMSKKFRSLFDKAKEESPIAPQPAVAGAYYTDAGAGGFGGQAGAGTDGGTGPIGSAKSAFCTNCGAKVPDNVKFCGSCGTPVA